MKLQGEQVIEADRMAVWNAINDPDILKRCISGCEEMTRTSPTRYDAVVRQKIGPVSATFKGVVDLSDVVEGESLRLHGEGKGGVAGMAKGGALVTLSDVEGGTRLSYDAEASVAGKLAQLGSRLIDGVAQKMIGSFFSNFKDEVEAGPGGASGHGSDVHAATAEQTGTHGATMAAAAGAAGIAGAAASSHASDTLGDAGSRAEAAYDAGAASVSNAGAAASAHAGDAMQGVRSDADARTGALHDAQAERMLNPAIGAGAGEIDMDDPEIGDIDVSSVDGGPSEAEADAMTNAGTAARAAGSQDGVDVAGNLSTMADSFDPEGSFAGARDHVGAAGDAATASADGAAQDAMAAADRVGEQVATGAADARTQADAMDERAANASRSAMEGARDDALSGEADAGGSTANAAFPSHPADAAAAAEQVTAIRADGDMQAHAASSGAAPLSTMPEGAATPAPERPVTEPDDTRISGADAAVAGGIGAAVSGFAARAQGTFDETHDKVRERVIAAGGDVDEGKSWGDTKEHLSRAAAETRDTAQDVYDAARARVQGDKDRASAEWNDAKTNAGDTMRELKGAGEDAWTTGKGYAAEEAKAPKLGPLGQPWYLWIIGIVVLLVILWLL